MTFDRLDQRIASEEFERASDEYAQAQRQAFIDGLEAAADEAETFRHLRDWLEEQRDKAEGLHEETDEDTYLARQLAFSNVLVKLSQLGCEPENTEGEDGE